MKLFKELSYDRAVFIDIETVSGVKTIDPEKTKDIYNSWEYKMRYDKEHLGSYDALHESYESKAALFPEFNKIVCITMGMVLCRKDEPDSIYIKTFSNHDEKTLLIEFTEALNKFCKQGTRPYLTGYSITGFDIPCIYKRCMINGVEPNYLFDTADAKPWELKETIKDIYYMWKGTSFASASLLNVATAFNLPSPKVDIAGFETSKVYWGSKDGLERIARYCERDVITTINIVRKCRFEDPLEYGDFKLTDQKTAKILKTTKKDKKVLEGVGESSSIPPDIDSI